MSRKLAAPSCEDCPRNFGPKGICKCYYGGNAKRPEVPYPIILAQAR